ncbi:IucC family-domain-containing protein [Lentinula raphanica]|uniref:IucC family-domain-containing protein n=1 Tax=Lentinula raphanica TaxID=153919 RepID=A0AA38PDJ1_9AGAR|nr:IucC family-domain-containing protein [Lentinula raphanica]KAJ3974595.1 IucC family-domain-containing protein [Lentinula raphanica]
MIPPEPFSLDPDSRAAHAIWSRLLSCLVTESLLRAFYHPLPLNAPGPAKGIMVILSTNLISERPTISRALVASDIYAIVPMYREPVLKKEDPAHKHGRPIALVDPLDMLPEIYELAENSSLYSTNDFHRAVFSVLAPPPWKLSNAFLSQIEDPILLWDRFAQELVLPTIQRDSIRDELASSLYWQRLAYENAPSCPSIKSPSIDWEQSLVEGHPTHPMHRARMLPFDMNSYDWTHPKIYFVRVPRSSLSILGPFESVMNNLVNSAAANAGINLPSGDSSAVSMPVHEIQLDSVLAKFPDTRALDRRIHVVASAQSSTRTVLVPELPGMSLKLSVGVKISSALRTISHYTADFGPRFSEIVIPRLSIDRNLLTVECEPASAVYRGVEPDVAKHFTAILRNFYQPASGENVIVCAALLESGHTGTPKGVSAVEHAFGLDTFEKKSQFLDHYLQVACKALIPPLIHNGVAFEAHAQNVLARFDTSTGRLLGFVIRDLGGLRIHPPTMTKSIGTEFPFLEGHCIATETVEEAYPKFYHTFIHNHVQRLIRVLGMHYDGSGWEILRRHLKEIIPADHGLYKAWLDPSSAEVSGKCLMRMRLQGSYRDHVYSPFPNMIHYRGTSEAVTPDGSEDA